MEIILGIGTNQGTRLNNLSIAIDKINSFAKVIKVADIYESDALLLENSPEEWSIPFLNTALLVENSLSPEKMLSKCQQLEKEMGRAPNHSKWSPRIIDIDILIYDNLIVNRDNLTIPHPELHNRLFVLLPLYDLIPDWICPTRNKSLKEMINTIKQEEAELSIHKIDCNPK